MRNILLTGGGGGIARAIAPLLAAEPFRLLLTTREGNALESFCKENNIQAEVFSADLTLHEDVEALFDWAETFGGVDVLINNAGISHAAASWKLTAEEMHRLMEVNFYSAVRCTQLALQGMRVKSYGRIISVSSVVAHKPAFGTSAYTASKSALEGYMRGVALDVSTQGITANTIAYGYMNASSSVTSQNNRRLQKARFLSTSASITLEALGVKDRHLISHPAELLSSTNLLAALAKLEAPKRFYFSHRNPVPLSF